MAYLSETLRESTTNFETYFIEFQDALLETEKEETMGDGLAEETVHTLIQLIDQLTSQGEVIKELLENVELHESM